MAYDERLAGRVRQELAAEGDVAERKMMGALCFMLGGHMCCGVTGAALMVRVGREAYDDTLAEPHVAPMEIAGRPTVGFVTVDAAGIRSDAALAGWIRRATAFVSTLPPKGRA